MDLDEVGDRAMGVELVEPMGPPPWSKDTAIPRVIGSCAPADVTMTAIPFVVAAALTKKILPPPPWPAPASPPKCETANVRLPSERRLVSPAQKPHSDERCPMPIAARAPSRRRRPESFELV